MNVWVDDLRNPYRYLSDDFPVKDFVWAKTIEDAIQLLESGKVRMIFLDHDLGDYYTSALDIVDWMAEHRVWPEFVYVHSANPVGVANMLRTIDRYGGYDQRTKDGRGRYRTGFRVMENNNVDASGS